jgi:RNA polymerase sigma-70 factor (ECF subfamily)
VTWAGRPWPAHDGRDVVGEASGLGIRGGDGRGASYAAAAAMGARPSGGPVREALVQLARDGDRDAFDVLLETSMDALFATAYRIVRDFDLAEDAVQDALVSAWRDLPGLRAPDRFDAWLNRLLIRASVRHSRRERVARVVVRPLQLSVERGPADDGPHADLEAKIAGRDEMDRAFRHLSPDHRAVLVVTHYLGLTATEAAGVLDIPIGTVKSRLHHATRALRAALETEERSSAIRREAS